MSSNVHPGPGCNCSECNPLRAYTDMSARLTEATALLETADTTPRDLLTANWRVMVRAWLSRAPAPPAAPEPSGEPKACPHCMSPDGHCPWHTVPRVVAAESKLAAVRERIEYWSAEPYARSWPPGVEVLRDIEKLLRPTPGTGGEGGER